MPFDFNSFVTLRHSCLPIVDSQAGGLGTPAIAAGETSPGVVRHFRNVPFCFFFSVGIGFLPRGIIHLFVLVLFAVYFHLDFRVNLSHSVNYNLAIFRVDLHSVTSAV